MVLAKRKELDSSFGFWPYLLLLIVVALAVLCISSSVAFAADNTGSSTSGGAFSTGEGWGGDWGQLDSFIKKFKSLAAGSDGTMLGFATSLFGKLILLDFAIAALMNVVQFGEFNQSFAMLVGKMFKYGFWMWVITNWTSGIDICNIILQSFSEAGSAAGASGYGSAAAGAETLEHPSYIISKGFGYASAYFMYILAPKGLLELAISVAAPFTMVWKFIVACFGALGILVAFLMIGLNLVTTLIEFYLVSSFGLILIPFAAFEKTEQFGAQNFRYVMGIGIKLMFMAAIIGMMSTTVWSMGFYDGLTMGDLTNFASRPGVGQTVQAVLMAWIFAYIACEVPAIAGAALSGSPSLTGHNLMAHAAGAAAAIYGAGQLATSLGGGAVGLAGAMGGAGGAVSNTASAASAAFKGAGGGVSGAFAGMRAAGAAYASSASSQMGAAWRNATTGLATSINEGAVKAQDRADKGNYGHYNPPFGYNDNPRMSPDAKGEAPGTHPEAAFINNAGGSYSNEVTGRWKERAQSNSGGQPSNPQNPSGFSSNSGQKASQAGQQSQPIFKPKQ